MSRVHELARKSTGLVLIHSARSSGGSRAKTDDEHKRGEKTMKEFMFIYKGGDPEWRNAPAEQKQAVMAAWGKWFEALGARGQLVTGGSPLEFEGKRITKDGVITDIAASEFKELVTGYSIVKAKDAAEAAKIARECPIFRMKDALVEVRAILPM
jgi:hypothetical protein